MYTYDLCRCARIQSENTKHRLLLFLYENIIIFITVIRTHLVQINTHMRRTKYLKTHTNYLQQTQFPSY